METRRGSPGPVMVAACLAMALAAGTDRTGAVRAAELHSGPDLRLRWDNTVKFSSAWRVQRQSQTLLAPINADDGDRNFDRGFISTRLDLLSEVDLTYRERMGLRASGAGWYDLLYNLRNDNDSPGTVNSFSVPPDHFTHATRDLHGRRAELLDALAFATTDVRGLPVNVRAGRHTLLWGESVLIPDNSIANAQAPLDVIKGLSVPASQAKELFMPVTQVSAQVGPLSGLSVAGFYQFEWRRTRLPAAGSYFSTTDILDAGGERLLLPMGALFRGKDLTASNLGQWGVAVRYQVTRIDTELAGYFINYHDKLPQVYLRPGAAVDPSIGKVGEYFLAFQENIRLAGGSFSTAFGPWSVQGEGHVRLGTPLASAPQMIMPTTVADNDDHPLYALGNTVHAQLSTVHVFAPRPFWSAANLIFEAAGQGLLKITRNKPAFEATKRYRFAWGVRGLFIPTYYQVLPDLDLSIPMTLVYNPSGKAPIAVFNGGADRGGNASLGLSGEYRKVWLASVQFSLFFGRPEYQPRNDRAFVSAYLQRTF